MVLAGQLSLPGWSFQGEERSARAVYSSYRPPQCSLIWDNTSYFVGPMMPFPSHGITGPVLSCSFTLTRPIPRFFTQGGSVAKAILMDEFHITVYALAGLAPPAYDAIRQALDDPRFKADLRRAVRTAFRRHLPSDQVRVTVTQ
jgi:hypothetical protein